MLRRNLSWKKNPSKQGFTMIEVLLAILTVTLFLTGTLQLIAIDTLYKIKNKQEAQASFWIQEDLEQVRELASQTGDMWAKAKCYPDPTKNLQDTYAYVLQEQIQNRDNSDPKLNIQLPGSVPRALLADEGLTSQNPKEYKLSRNYRTITTDQSNVLKIDYKVEDINALANSKNKNNDINKQRDAVIATQYAEVIPNESFKCHQ